MNAVESAASPIHLILVPGTWGYGVSVRGGPKVPAATPARWFEAGSTFRSEVEAALTAGGVEATVEIQHWDAANSVASRYKTAESLSYRIRERASRGVLTVVIAHSHGGNIACRAADLARDAEGHLAVVTLATPFLRATDRDGDAAKTVLAICAIAAGFVTFVSFAYAAGDWRVLPALKNYALGFLLALPIFSAIVWFGLSDSSELRFKMNYRSFDVGRLLVVRGFSDEATLAIVVGAIGTGIVNTLFFVLGAPLAWVWDRSWGPAVTMIGGVALVVGLIAGLPAAFTYVGMWRLLVIAQVVLLLPVLVAGVSAAGFGREMFRQCINLALTVDSTPDSRASADIVTLSAVQSTAAALRHGIYTHRGCAATVARWIVRLVDERRRARDGERRDSVER